MASILSSHLYIFLLTTVLCLASVGLCDYCGTFIPHQRTLMANKFLRAAGRTVISCVRLPSVLLYIDAAVDTCAIELLCQFLVALFIGT